MKPIYVVIVFVLLTIARTDAYESGDGIGVACTSMIPGHYTTGRNISEAPYAVKTNMAVTAPGGTVKVIIEGTTSNATFKGFMLQARGIENNEPMGTWSLLEPGSHRQKCSNSYDMVSHSDNAGKNNRTFTWMSPLSFSGNVTFYATIVQKYDIFFVKLQSSAVLVDPSLPVPTTPSETSTSPKDGTNDASIHARATLLFVYVLAIFAFVSFM